MATVTKPIALDESFHTTEQNPRNIADVLLEGLSHITGRTASEVEYDNTESGLTSDDVQGAIDELSERPTLPSVDIQTAVDEFSTYNGGLLSSLKVSLEPIQDLHGYDSPWVGGAKKNKLNSTLVTEIIRDGITCSPQFDDGGNLIGYQLSGTATANADFRLYNAYGSTDVYIPSGTYKVNNTGAINGIEFHNGYGNDSYPVAYGNTDTEITCLNGIAWTILRVTNGTVINTPILVQPMIRLATESDPTFEPYENICPISGHTEVQVQNHQKNLFNPSNVIIGYIGQSGGAYKIIAYADARTIYARCEPNTTYTISKTAGKRFSVGWSDTLPDIGVIVNDSVYDTTASVVTFTTGATAKYIVAFVWLGTQDTITADEMLASCQIELGSTATPYEPYNGYQITVNLGGTYYSGTLDVVSGELTVDSAFIASYNGETLPSTWISDRDVYAVGTTPTTGAEVCYKLATPTPIQLSPTMVKALVGENHLDAPLDGQEITESKYKQAFTFDDVIAYIQSL